MDSMDTLQPVRTFMPPKASERQYFILACFSGDLQTFYQQWIGRKKDRIQFFWQRPDGTLEHHYWWPGPVCCHSGQRLDPGRTAIKVGYWRPHLWRPIHPDYLQQAQKIETLACQQIDCSCNDCRFFERSREQYGHCKKFDKPTIAYPNQCCPENLTCFEHRRLTPAVD